MKCFYHSADLDGHCAGAIVKKALPECEMVGLDYDDTFPWEDIIPSEVVYLVDISLQPFENMELLDTMVHLFWIDHHKSTIKAAQEARVTFEGIQLVGQAACELTWDYFYPEKPVPLAVRLLGRYDVWDHRDPRVLPFQLGMKAYDTDPENQGFWYDFFVPSDQSPRVSYIITKGQAIGEYMDRQCAEGCARTAFETKIDGLSCLAANVNAPFARSQFFDSAWDPQKYDAMCAFGRRSNGKWVISLYTTHKDIDVGELARRRGGGGHQKAAGFVCKTLPEALA